MNLLDRAIAPIAPGWAARRARARYQLNVLNRAYDATNPGRFRKHSHDYGSGTAASRGAVLPLRVEARNLERNHDLARGALNTLVQNTIGAAGILVEPHPLRLDGTLHEEFARQLARFWRDWTKRPEVTWQHDWPSAQRLAARSYFRDGEMLMQRLTGLVAKLDHGTTVPYSLELIEADQLPLYYESPGQRIIQGVELNGWGRPRAYHVLKSHPGDYFNYAPQANDVKRIPAERILHLKAIDRIGQVRGVSLFASIITRLLDIKDYEESERIAAKVAASMAAVIVKGSPDLYPDSAVDAEKRHLKFTPGMVFDDLRPGETVETIDSKRPNSNLESFRSGQLRAGAAGIGISYSSFSKNYNGTYSSQRQELVENYGAYGVLAAELINSLHRPVYEDFVQAAVNARLVDMPADLDPATLYDAIYVPPSMPWIDPLKEAEANEMLEQAGFVSGPEIIRRRGGNPREVLEQEASWRREAERKQLQLSTNPASAVARPPRTGDDNAQSA